MNTKTSINPAEAATVAYAKATVSGLSVERATKRAREAEELAWIGIIAHRAYTYISAHPNDFDVGERDVTNALIMLIQVKQANPNLNLKRFAEFDDKNFLHDFFGIARYAKPRQGNLVGYSSRARCAANQTREGCLAMNAIRSIFPAPGLVEVPNNGPAGACRLYEPTPAEVARLRAAFPARNPRRPSPSVRDVARRLRREYLSGDSDGYALIRAADLDLILAFVEERA